MLLGIEGGKKGWMSGKGVSCGSGVVSSSEEDENSGGGEKMVLSGPGNRKRLSRMVVFLYKQLA
jgi:hypothetical protein